MIVWKLFVPSTKTTLTTTFCVHSSKRLVFTFSSSILVEQEWAHTHLTISDVKNYFLTFSPGQVSLLSQMRWLLQLIVVMPATNSSSEWSLVHWGMSKATLDQRWGRNDWITWCCYMTTRTGRILNPQGCWEWLYRRFSTSPWNFHHVLM